MLPNYVMFKNNSKKAFDMKSKKPLLLVIVSTLLAIATHAYLYSNHLQLKSGSRESTPICHISSKFSCDAAVASQFSELFGVPLALWGVLANFGLLVLVGMYLLGDRDNKRGLTSIYIASVGLAAVSIIMAMISVLFLQSYCPFCILAYIFSFLTLAGAHWYVGGFKNLRFDPGVITQFAIIGVPLLIMGFALHYKAKGDAGDMEPIIRAAVGKWQSGPKLELLVPFEPIVVGAPKEKAKMTIVEFADFRCSHCRDAAPILKAFIQAHPDTRLEFQVYPLDAQCNPQMQQGDGAGCLLAASVFCAQKLASTGVAVQDYVFLNQRSLFTPAAIKEKWADVAKVAGVAPDQLLACTETPEMKKLITDQAKLGNQVGIQGTPTIFVNGKKLEYGHNLDVLQRVYQTL